MLASALWNTLEREWNESDFHNGILQRIFGAETAPGSAK